MQILKEVFHSKILHNTFLASFVSSAFVGISDILVCLPLLFALADAFRFFFVQAQNIYTCLCMLNALISNNLLYARLP